MTWNHLDRGAEAKDLPTWKARRVLNLFKLFLNTGLPGQQVGRFTMLNDDMNNSQLFDALALKKNDLAVRRMRAALSLAMATLLSACAFAPGQHMAERAALQIGRAHV